MTYLQAIRYAGKMSGHNQGVVACALHWASILDHDGYHEEAERLRDLSSLSEDIYMSVCAQLQAQFPEETSR